MGITYEQLTGDLTNVNYSSIRAGLMNFVGAAPPCTSCNGLQFCRPVWIAGSNWLYFRGALPAQDKDASIKGRQMDTTRF